MEQTKWHQLSVEELRSTLGVSLEEGLTDEAVAQKRKVAGSNELSEGKRISPITLLLNQFKDFMVLVLMGATLVSGLLGEYLDAVTIVAIIVLNAILGFVQEFRAERSLRALKQLSAPLAKVLRAGQEVQLAAKQLVPGDIILVESGDRIPADVRWLETNSLDVEESALTGESVPVSKHCNPIADDAVPLGDQKTLDLWAPWLPAGRPRALSFGQAWIPRWVKLPI